MRVLSLLTVLCLLLVVLLMDGCAIAPNTISPVVSHTSHIAQHFGSNKTEYGYNEVGLQAHWRLYRGAFLDVTEGYNWGDINTDGQACAGLYGGRDVFTATVGYSFVVKP